jgi:ElaB/YqjD/DUF883 family membrane-anchored ribosome-binding protein
MAEGTEPIRQDIDAIRDSMTEKMEQIEAKVKGTVENTVDTVKRTFDIRQQVEERPWTALGVAVAVGFVVGSLGGDDRGSERSFQRYAMTPDYPDVDQQALYRAKSGNNASSKRTSDQPYSAYRAKPSIWDEVTGQFGNEFNTLAQSALSAAFSMLRDNLREAIPQFSREYEKARQQRVDLHRSNDDQPYQNHDDDLLRQNLEHDLMNQHPVTGTVGGRVGHPV